MSLIASILFGGGASYLGGLGDSDVSDLNLNIEILTQEVKSLSQELQASQASLERLVTEVESISK
ncbi:MAG: hypothetical protein AAF579_23160 [Cyanobacteria bacterium P01_C01_bin.118]